MFCLLAVLVCLVLGLMAADARGQTLIDLDTVALNDSLVADHTASGTKITDHVGATVAFPNVLYMGSGGVYLLADAEAEATTRDLVMALAAGTAGSDVSLLRSGYVRDDSWSWTPGQTIYLSTTGGGITSTAPSASGDIVIVIGHAVAAKTIYFNPDRTFVEID